ncbi:TIGR03943 family putative permease subunit [Streptomyces sp. NPDC058371]|uniref:TIGR03943 family putative permease subunit n=1 Tax=Streptomyces sp. NPDC058371 TaxID=3346463 RepID=UPI00364E0894
MRRYGPSLLLLLSGAAILRISLFSDLYLRYVQQGLRPYLIASGLLLATLSLTSAIHTARTLRRPHFPPTDALTLPPEDPPPPPEGATAPVDGSSGPADGATAPADGPKTAGTTPEAARHDHSRTPRIAWLLAVPASALLVFPPPALGSYSADREAAQRAAQGIGTFPALPAGNPVDLTLGEFTSRAIYDKGRSLTGRTVRMTGFVTRGANGTWYLARLRITCCAADASTYKIRILDADAPAADTWITLTGTWHPKGTLGSTTAWPPVLEARTLKQTPEPENPYERR